MSIASGTRFGNYEITEPIGAGGMGEVYRATDTKLGREIAIKTLPAALTEDADRLARFEREARLLASLNHAHIASVYGLDQHNDTHYIAMELIEGESLEDKLKAGPLPVEDALDIARQIAEALEAAHDRGVVHRDLKPANIMLTRDGVVKVLDFGLAKAFAGDPDEASPGHSPALSLAMTKMGYVLGTAGYMSPEQASGQATDQRADIWAFGVVLYEMLTGQPLFGGETVPHILADVLRSAPDWTRLPTALHPNVEQLLERCLEKKPRDRYHSIADVRIELAKIARDPHGLHAGRMQAAPRRGGVALLAAAVVGGLVVAAALALTNVLFQSPPALAPVKLFTDPMPDERNFRRAGRRAITVSPDGLAYVYNSSDGLILRRFGDAEALPIRGTESDLNAPVFSPDGDFLIYFDIPARQLRRIPVTGGTSLFVADVPQFPYGISWEDDGSILYGQSDGIWSVPAGGGAPAHIVTTNDGEQAYGPRLLPDGEHLLYSISSGNDWNGGTIYVHSLSTDVRTAVYEGGNDARYIPTGHLVFAVNTTLFAIAFDLESLETSGSAFPVLEDVMRSFSNTGIAQYDVARNGSVVYLTGTTEEEGEVIWVSMNGQEEPIEGLSGRDFEWTRISPDGTRIALAIYDGEQSDIWVSEHARGTLTRVTNDEGFDGRPLWLPDGFVDSLPAGEHIAFISDREGAPALYVKAADGSGLAESLLTFEGLTNLRLFEVAGDTIIFGFLTASTGNDIGLITFDGTEASWAPLLVADGGQGSPTVSSAGDWYAYNSDDSGVAEVYIERFPSGGDRRQISVDNGIHPIFADDGRTLFYRSNSGRGDIMQVVLEVDADGRLTPGPAERLFQDRYFSSSFGRSWDYSSRDQRFLMTRFESNSAMVEADAERRIEIVQNWFTQVEDRDPANR